MNKLWGLGALFIVVCGCAGPRHAASAGATPPPAAELDAAMRKAAEARSNYKLSPDDLLSVSVYQDKDLGARTHVDGDGAISLPLAGTVSVAGATVGEAQKRIEEKLSRFLVNPQVTITVESYGNKQLFVLGEVQKPGPYPMPVGGRVTLLQAITDAGGFTKGAAPRRTHVLRYADGKSEDLKVDLKTLISHGDREKDMILEANDVVYVPQTYF